MRRMLAALVVALVCSLVPLSAASAVTYRAERHCHTFTYRVTHKLVTCVTVRWTETPGSNTLNVYQTAITSSSNCPEDTYAPDAYESPAYIYIQGRAYSWGDPSPSCNYTSYLAYSAPRGAAVGATLSPTLRGWGDPTWNLRNTLGP